MQLVFATIIPSRSPASWHLLRGDCKVAVGRSQENDRFVTPQWVTPIFRCKPVTTTDMTIGFSFEVSNCEVLSCCYRAPTEDMPPFHEQGGHGGPGWNDWQCPTVALVCSELSCSQLLGCLIKQCHESWQQQLYTCFMYGRHNASYSISLLAVLISRYKAFSHSNN